MNVVHVGARLEVVAPRKIIDRRDLGYLLLLLAISLIVHGWQIINNPITAKDSIGFARYGWNLFHPNDGIPVKNRSAVEIIKDKNNHHPPGFPLLIGLVANIVVPLTQGPLPNQLALSTQIASAFAALLMVVPTYALGRLLFSRGVGFGVALLLQVMPVFAREATDGLNDCAHLCLVAFALLFAARGFRRPRVGQFLLAGLFSGLAYIVRPEGLELVAAVTLVMIGFVIKRIWPLRTTIGLFIALGVGALLTSSPYMMMIRGISNKPSGDIGAPLINPRMPAGQGQGLVDGPPFAAAYRDLNYQQRISRTPVEFVQETLKTTHYSVGVLGVIGLLLLRPRFREQPELWLLIVYAGLHTLLLFSLGLMKGYLSERHILPLAMCLTYFAVAGLRPLCDRLARLPLVGPLYRHPAAPAVIVALIVLSCVPGLLKTRHKGRIGQVQAGEFLKGKIDEHDQLYDPYEWAGFYSERTLYSIPPDPYMTAGRYRWIVWEKDDTNNSLQSDRWREAKAFLESGRAELVRQFEVPNVKQVVEVYRMPFTDREIQADAQRKEQEKKSAR